MMRSFESKSPATDNGFRATLYEEMSHERPTMANINPRFYVSTSKSIIKALINMHSFEIQLSPIG
ncbi:hypothetical protein FOB38_00200 (plasmid) [Klebsiella pneumoniae]|nr:hypothetical protein FOB38_00200 [Klebsiella pneumoniae]